MGEVELRFRSVERLVKAAETRGLDEETASYYCKLGSVLICGAVERSVESIINDRIARRAPPQVATFLKSYFRRGTNYTCDEITKLLAKLDSRWSSEFDLYLKSNSNVKESISSCYAIRNSVAHGGTQSLGSALLRQYFDDSFTLVVQVEYILRS